MRSAANCWMRLVVAAFGLVVLVVPAVNVLTAQVRVTGSVPDVEQAAHARDGAATAAAMAPAMRSWRESEALEKFGIPNPAKEIPAIISMLNQLSTCGHLSGMAACCRRTPGGKSDWRANPL